jgi:hypothetical protein
VKLFFAAGAVALVAFLNVGEADAHTCSSLCNQIKRACNAEAKAAKKVALATCDEERDTCREGCADPNTPDCVIDCAGEHTACVAACALDPDPVACQAACDAALAECPDTCVGCCNYMRASCRADARADRQAARLACTDSRVTCLDACVDPIDRSCLRTCTSAQRSCRSSAKRTVWSPCKEACPNGKGRRACMRGCRKELNEALKACSYGEVLCLGGCINLGP